MPKRITTTVSETYPAPEKTSPLAIFTIGVTASGKTTWAKSLSQKFPLLRITVIPTPVPDQRDEQHWRQQVSQSMDMDAIILDGANLDPSQLQRDISTLQALGITDIDFKYFAPESLFVLISRNGGLGGEQIRTELQQIRSRDHYWALLDG